MPGSGEQLALHQGVHEVERPEQRGAPDGHGEDVAPVAAVAVLQQGPQQRRGDEEAGLLGQDGEGERDARADPGDDLVAAGADLEPGTLLAAYRLGLFPMGLGPHGTGAIGWWSPDPRGVIPAGGLRVSRSLRKVCDRFEVRVDTAFDEVVARCADPSREGRWITPEVARAYGRLHELGEWQGDLLLGVDPAAPRRESVVELDPGTTVLMFTDGLIERRAGDLDSGMAQLREVAEMLADRSLDEMCDEIIEQLVHARALSPIRNVVFMGMGVSSLDLRCSQHQCL